MQSLFQPKNITVIGASTNPKKIGQIILKNIKNSNYQGQIFPVNPKPGKILDIPVITDLQDLAKVLDLVVIVLPAKLVLENLKKILDLKKIIKNLIVISAGFKEVGNVAGEKELSQLCSQNQINLVGPNCLGIANNSKDLQKSYNASFGLLPKRKGNVALISQSGALISSFVDKADRRGFGFSKIISLGNKAGLDEAEFINFLNKDSETKVIALYLEGFSQVPNLIEALAKTDKPVILIKGGQSEVGQKAVSSHTGSLAGNYAVAKTYLDELRAVQPASLEEFFNTIFLFSKFG